MGILDFLKQQRVFPHYDINDPLSIPLQSYNHIRNNPMFPKTVAQVSNFLTNSPNAGVMGFGVNQNYDKRFQQDEIETNLANLQTNNIRNYYSNKMPGEMGFGVSETMNDQELYDFYQADTALQAKAVEDAAKAAVPNTGIFGDDVKTMLMIGQAAGLFGDKKPATQIAKAQATPGLQLNVENPYDKLRRGIFG